MSRSVDRSVLFTNIYGIDFGPRFELETDAHALLLSHNRWDAQSPNVFTATGFGAECAARLFMLHLHSIEWWIDDNKGGDGRMLPWKTLNTSGFKFKLRLSDGSKPLDVVKYDQPDAEQIEHDLVHKVVEYWRAPFIPAMVYGPREKHDETRSLARLVSAALQKP